MKNVDARGLSCPQPVILARKAIAEGQFPIVVLVDTATSRENIRRMAEKAGCIVVTSLISDEFVLHISQ